MKCVEGEYSYRGARFRVSVYTSSSEVCDEVKEAKSGGVGKVLDFVREHGGCRVRSESPLRVSSGDNTTLVEVEPANALARMLWGEVVRRAREVCAP